ncbi:Ribosome biogenesis protein NSA1 [Nakaseomyces bracarensis]|uniref:Ribosome biogenesis protein NSA1 n=1 Tax=Nakaseomyces bracarensis TaxID=273131 RepID=A0ABR4NPQ5_9SACH
MRIYTSCIDNGALKEFVCGPGTDTSVQTAAQPLLCETHMPEGLNSAIEQITEVDDKIMLIARRNGSVQLVSRELKSEQEDKPSVSEFSLLDTVSGLLDNSRLDPFNASSKKRTKLVDGFLSIASINDEGDYLVGTKSGLIHIIKLRTDKLEKLNTLEVRAPLDFVQFYDIERTNSPTFACGGEENLVRLFEIQKNYSEIINIWEAKNVKNDRLDMRVPVWPVALKFFKPMSTDSPGYDSSKPNFQFVVITKWSHLGIYKTQHGKRPLKYIDLLPNREPLLQLEIIDPETNPLNFTPEKNYLSADINNFEFITTDLKRDVMRFNQNGRLISKYGRGDITGAATHISIYNQKYLLQGGLDRYLRVFKLSDRTILDKIYVGANINKIMIMEDDVEVEIIEKSNKKRSAKNEDEESDEEDAEKLWSELEKKNKKKQKK